MQSACSGLHHAQQTTSSTTDKIFTLAGPHPCLLILLLFPRLLPLPSSPASVSASSCLCLSLPPSVPPVLSSPRSLFLPPSLLDLSLSLSLLRVLYLHEPVQAAVRKPVPAGGGSSGSSTSSSSSSAPGTPPRPAFADMEGSFGLVM